MLDSCGTSGTGETPQERKRRGGSPHSRQANGKHRVLNDSSVMNFFNIFPVEIPSTLYLIKSF